MSAIHFCLYAWFAPLDGDIYCSWNSQKVTYFEMSKASVAAKRCSQSSLYATYLRSLQCLPIQTII